MLAALFLVGCRGEEEIVLQTAPPSVASTLPGNTVALYVPGPDAAVRLAPPADLLGMLPEGEGLELRELPDGVLAGIAGGVKVGWPDLATARPFREAWAEVPEGARGVGYVDLQILFDLATEDFENTMFERVVEALGIRAGIAAIAWGEPGDAALEDWRGTLLSTGSRRGVFALLGESAPPELLADGDGRELRVDGRFRIRAARGILWELTADRGGMSGSNVMTQMGGPLLEMLRDMLRHLDGRFAVRARSPEDFDVAFGIEDARGVAAELSGIGRELDEGTFQLPAGRYVRIDGDRLLLITEEDAETPPPHPGGSSEGGEPAPGLRMLVPAGFVPGDPGAILELWQVDRRRTELRLRVDPGPSGK